MDVDLSVILGSVKFKNPLIISGGVINDTLLLKAMEYDVGGVTIGSIALKPKSTHPPPFIVKVPYGFVNAYGIRRGLSDYEDILAKVIDKAESTNTKVICSCIEENLDEIVYLAKELESRGCSVIELNLSAPIIKKIFDVGLRGEVMAKIVREVSRNISRPLSVKLSPLILDIADIANRLHSSGARIIHLINALSPALVIDLETGKPLLKTKNGLGALSGPAIKPIALAKVMLVAKSNPHIPIIGTGGVSSWSDAIEMILAGASAVGIHSALYIHSVKIVNEIITGMKQYLIKKGLPKITDIRGLTIKYTT